MCIRDRDSDVLMSQRLSEAIFHQTESAQKNLREAQDFDRKWYVDRGAALAWPPVERRQGIRDCLLYTSRCV